MSCHVMSCHVNNLSYIILYTKLKADFLLCFVLTPFQSIDRSFRIQNDSTHCNIRLNNDYMNEKH